MAKSRDEIERAVVAALQKFAGSSTPLRSSDKPITGLGLTSMEGHEFVTVLEQELGCAIDNTENAFKTEDGTERTVVQIVDYAVSRCTRAGVPSK